MMRVSNSTWRFRSRARRARLYEKITHSSQPVLAHHMAQSDLGPIDGRHEAMLELGQQLHALLSSARAHTADVSGCVDPALSSTSFQILQWLHAFGPSRAMRIAEALVMDRGSLSRLLRQLTEDSFLEMTADPSNDRLVLYRLTGETTGRMDRALGNKEQHYRERLRTWPESDVRELATLLARFNRPPNTA